MRTINTIVVVLTLVCGFAFAEDGSIPNPRIDYNGFLENAAKVQKLRNERRISEERFIFMSREPGTIIFDARSDSKFAMLHIKGAKHLSLPDITADELAKIIPDKSTRILIYCNNNFENEPKSLPSKFPRTSLNIYTFNTLYSYGYTNVYELGPLLDIKNPYLLLTVRLFGPTSKCGITRSSARRDANLHQGQTSSGSQVCQGHSWPFGF
jgi:rhodanese-like protein